MRAEDLLDAFGMVDDRFLADVPQQRFRTSRFLVLAAVVAALILCTLTAAAFSEDFREIVFSVFRIPTVETPPVQTIPSETMPTETGLREVEVVEIDAGVTARYFAKDGIIRTEDGGFYTCDYDTHANPAFWEITSDGITQVPATHVEFPLEYGGRNWLIRFDYCILNQKLAIEVWPDGLGEDPVGNGWNLTPIGSRLDAALLSIPVLEGEYYHFHYLLLDLEERTTEVILAAELPLDYAVFTDDLRYAIGISGSEYWFFDLEKGTSVSFGSANDPYFLNNETIICKIPRADGTFDLVQHHILSGVSRVLLESMSRKSGETGYRGIHSGGAEGYHGLIYQDAGTVDVFDLRTAERIKMNGLDQLDKGYLRTDESPLGSRILIAYEQSNEAGELGCGFTSLGLLDPRSSVLKLLRRNVSGHTEYLWGWLDETTVVILGSDNNSAYWVYTYSFE